MPEITKFIRIEGEVVSAVEQIVHRSTPLAEWLVAMKKLEPTALATPVLPVGTCLYAQKGLQQLVAINQPASVKKVIWRTLAYRDTTGDARARTRWTLAIPAHLFVLVLQNNAIYSSHLFYVEKEVDSEKQMLFRNNLANVYSSPRGTRDGIPSPICSGTIRMDVKDPLAKRCQQYIDHFWASEFNDDISPVTDRRRDDRFYTGTAIPAQLQRLNEWDAATAEDAQFLTKMQWPFAPLCTLEELVRDKWQVAS